jgi:hypothetical protein
MYNELYKVFDQVLSHEARTEYAIFQIDFFAPYLIKLDRASP